MRSLLRNSILIVILVTLAFSSVSLSAAGGLSSMGGEHPTTVPVSSSAARVTPSKGSESSLQPAGQLVGWTGADYNTSTCGCLPPEGNAASGAGYLVQVVQGEVRVYVVGTHALLHNESLLKFFRAPTGTTVQYPVAAFDPAQARWFIAAVVVNASKTSGYVLVNVSQTANPELSWYQYRISPGAVLPERLLMALTSVQVLVTDDSFAGGVLKAADLWVLNKTALLDGSYKASDLFHYNSTTEMSWVPAPEIGVNDTGYFVTDCASVPTGTCRGGTALDFSTVHGVPPKAVSVRTFSLTIPASLCLPYSRNCTVSGGVPQRGGAGINISSGDLALTSAVWENGNLWAAGNAGCKVTTAIVACLHLIQVLTGTNKLARAIDYAPGNATIFYFDPSVSMDTASDLLLTFTKSGNSTLPTVEDSSLPLGGKMTTPAVAALSKVPYDPVPFVTAGVCNATVPCPWGTSSTASVEPENGSVSWFDAQYCPANCTSNYWSTWISKYAPTIPYTYYVTFDASGLPKGLTWSVNFRGVSLYSMGSYVSYLERNGTANYSVPRLAVGTTIRYVPLVATAPVNVSGKGVTVNVTFVEQFLLTTHVTPAASGTVAPATSWYDTNASVNLSATAGTGYAFFDWTGTGKGAYSGTSNPARFKVIGPVVETANFEPGSVVTISEGGLPAGTSWTVTLNGLAATTNLSSASFTVANGTYTYSVSSMVPLGYGDRAVATVDSGSVIVAGKAMGVSVSYTEQYFLSVSETPNGSGTVTPAAGWYTAHAVLNLTAGAAPGFRFLHWNGTGYGNYGGSSDPVQLTLNGPMNETAIFTSLGYIDGTVQPATAQVSIDSTLVPVNQGSFNTSATAGGHFLVVSAPGYQTLYLNLTVAAASGVSLALSLVPVPAPSSASGSGTILGISSPILLIIVVAVMAVLAALAFIMGRKLGKKRTGEEPPSAEPAPPGAAGPVGPGGPGYPGGPPAYPPPGAPPWGPQ